MSYPIPSVITRRNGSKGCCRSESRSSWGVIGRFSRLSQALPLFSSILPDGPVGRHSKAQSRRIEGLSRPVRDAHWQTLKLSKKKTEEVLVVTYSGPLNPNDPQDLAAYELFSQARKKFTKCDPLTSALYNASTNTVTLTPKGGKISAQPLELEIIAADVLDPLGRPLAGNGTTRGQLHGDPFAWGLRGGRRRAAGHGSMASGRPLAPRSLIPSSRERCQCALFRCEVGDLPRRAARPSRNQEEWTSESRGDAEIAERRSRDRTD